MMSREEMADRYGYERCGCGKCGWSGWSDTGVPECDCDEDGRCSECGEHEEECTCVECEACGERMEDTRAYQYGTPPDSMDLECPSCEYGGVHPDTVTEKSTVHVARKDHGYRIKAGDTYRRTVRMGHYQEGPRWLEVVKTLVKKGVVREAA